MAIGKDKERMSITIHKEVKSLMKELLSLHSNMTYSTLIEVSLMCYTKLVQSRLDTELEANKEGEENHAKN